MTVFTAPDYADHEQVMFCRDPATGCAPFIAVHSTARGPALGGCRMWPYPDEDAALTDVLRLARGMTYKAAMADLPFGGGKSVILGDPRRDKSERLLLAMGGFVDGLGGRYIIARIRHLGRRDGDRAARDPACRGHRRGGRRPIPRRRRPGACSTACARRRGTGSAAPRCRG